MVSLEHEVIHGYNQAVIVFDKPEILEYVISTRYQVVLRAIGYYQVTKNNDFTLRMVDRLEETSYYLKVKFDRSEPVDRMVVKRVVEEYYDKLIGGIYDDKIHSECVW